MNQTATLPRTTYEDVSGHFDGMADKYDKGCIKVNWQGPTLVFESVQEFLRLTDQPLHVLDLGTGTGQLGALFKLAHNSTHITGVDLAHKMLKEAEAHGRIDVAIQGSVTDLSAVEDSVCDVVTCAGVLDFVEDTELFAAEVTRVLKPGGIFSFTYEPVGTSQDGVQTLQHDSETLAQQFKRYGAKILKTSEVSGIYTNFRTQAPVHNNILVGMVPVLA